MTTRCVVHEAEAEHQTGRIDRLVARASVAAEEVRGHVDGTGAPTAPGVRDAVATPSDRDREAWRRYGEAVDAIAADAEARLVDARAELDLALAASKHDLDVATARLLDQWRGRLDDLKVQAALARMDAADEVAQPAVAQLEERVRRAARRAAALRDGSEDSLDILRVGVSEAFDTVREGFDDALVTLRRAARAGR